eukprot:scaffold24337_cov147-Cylindrotheca_fusiformis.AAC.1
MWRTLIIFSISAFVGVHCFQLLLKQQLLQQQYAEKQHTASRTLQGLAERIRVPTQWESSVRSRRDCLCPPEDGSSEEDEEDSVSDSAEAAFAMVGSLWAVGALPTEVVFPGMEGDRAWGLKSIGNDLEETELEMALQ